VVPVVVSTQERADPGWRGDGAAAAGGHVYAYNPGQEVDVMAAVQELVAKGILRLGYDRAGTSNTFGEDAGVDWKNKEAIKGSKWFAAFQGGVKKTLQAVAQSDVVRGGGSIVAVCIVGGPITECEREEMPRILGEAVADARGLGLGLRVRLEVLYYAEFRAKYGGA